MTEAGGSGRPLVGRASELAAFQWLLDAAWQGRGAFVPLGGVAGRGKTAPAFAFRVTDEVRACTPTEFARECDRVYAGAHELLSARPSVIE